MAALGALPALFGAGAAGGASTAATALSALGAGIGLIGSIQQGAAANRAAKQEAAQMEAKGKEERAAAQREAMVKQREGALVESRQRALAAASGGGTTDPTVVNLMLKTAGDAAYNAATVNYGGEQRQGGLVQAASNRRKEGRASLLGSVIGGFGTALRGLG